MHAATDKLSRILHVVTSLNVGGAERSLVSVVRSLREFDHAVVSLGDVGPIGKQLRELGTPVLPLHLLDPRRMAFGVPKLLKHIREYRPNVIQGWMYHGNVVAWLASSLARSDIPVLSNIRHSLYDIAEEKALTQLMIRANRRLSRRIAGVIYNSALSCGHHERFGFGGNSQVIANGFDLERWRPSAEHKRSVHEQLGVPAAAKLVGHFARYHPIKDHETFLRALDSVLARDPDVHAVLAGRGVDDQNVHLKRLISPQYDHRVHLLGERGDMERLMAALDVFCLSSSSEAFPNVVGEAMACGVPCVVTDVGDCEDLVGATGKLVPVRRPEEFAAALISLLAEDASTAQARRSAARERIRMHYSLDMTTQRYRSLYGQFAR